MTDWFGATTGLIGNTGAIGSPGDITSAWSGHSGAIQPRANIWMRGGTYQKTNSNFTISVSGAAGRGVDNADGNKVIHCTLREGCVNGVFSDTHTVRSEIYGCLSFNNGYAQSPGAHGLYVHHQGTKVFTIEGNVCFNMEGFGTQLYSVADAHDFIEYIDYKNNILFNAGALNNIASLGGVDAVLLE